MKLIGYVISLTIVYKKNVCLEIIVISENSITDVPSSSLLDHLNFSNGFRYVRVPDRA
jgi:hypothetical protein